MAHDLFAKGLPHLLLALTLLVCVVYWGRKLSRPEALCQRRGEDSLPLLSPVLALEVDRKLAPFRQRGVTKEDVQSAFSIYMPREMYLLAILGNRLYVKGKAPRDMEEWRLQLYFTQVLKLLCRHSMPDLELALNMGDIPLANKTRPRFRDPVALFGWSLTEEHWELPWPHFDMSDLPPTEADVDAAFNATAWALREPRAVWRGTTTGVTNTPDNFNTTPRARAVAMCQARTDLCDAGFVDVVQADEGVAELINQTFGLVPRIPWDEQVARFKCIIYIDGNGPAARNHNLLRQDVLPIWQVSEMYEFYMKALQPWRHYVPVSSTMEDLHSVISWSRAHEGAAAAIVAEGQAFARRHFNSRFITAYLHYLLSQYASLLRYAPTSREQLLAEGYQEVTLPRKCSDGGGPTAAWPPRFCVAKLAYQARGCPHWPPAARGGGLQQTGG